MKKKIDKDPIEQMLDNVCSILFVLFVFYAISWVTWNVLVK